MSVSYHRISDTAAGWPRTPPPQGEPCPCVHIECTILLVVSSMTTKNVSLYLEEVN